MLTIYNCAAGDWRCVDILSVRMLDLETTAVIIEEQRQCSIVSVCLRPKAILE